MLPAGFGGRLSRFYKAEAIILHPVLLDATRAKPSSEELTSRGFHWDRGRSAWVHHPPHPPALLAFTTRMLKEFFDV